MHTAMISSIAPMLLSRRKILSFVAAAVAVLLNILRCRCRRPKGLPIHSGHWLLGFLPEIAQAAARKEHNQLLWHMHQRLGKSYAVLGPLNRSCVITTDPKNVEHILQKNFDNYPKGWRVRTLFHDLLGNGIFNVDGQEWYHQRKTTSHMFTAKLFKEHIWLVVRQNACKVRSILKTTEIREAIDIFNLMNRFTLDTIGEIGFGKCIGSLEDPSSPFLSSFDRAQQITFKRFFSPLKFALLALGLGSERKSHHFARLDEYSRSVVRELHIDNAGDIGKENGVAPFQIEARKSFIGLFLEDARKRGEKLSEDYLRDLVLNFLIAGRDTTAQALSWTFYCLATNPMVEEKACQEIYEVCGAEDPTYDDLNHMPYLQAVVSEALRLHPSVPLDMKLAKGDDLWPDGTRISRGTNVVYNIYAMGRDPTIWGCDAEVFRPERWFQMKKGPSNYEYPIFNAGVRECLGKRLAMVEMKTCLAILLPHLSLELAVPADAITTDAQLTIGMASGLPCFVKLSKQRPRDPPAAALNTCTVASRMPPNNGVAHFKD